MVNNFLTRLAIAVQSLEDPAKSREQLLMEQHDAKVRTVLIIVLLIVIVGSVIYGVCGKKIAAYFEQKKKTSTQQRAEKKRDEELERLHEIKRKNKRK